MNRQALVLFALITCVSSTAMAQDPHKKWMNYFHGSWTSEASDGATGGVDFKFVPGVFAMVGTRARTPEGVQPVGWRPDRKVLVDTEYNADGSYSEIEYSEFGEKEMRGKFVHYWDMEKGDLSGATILVKIENQDNASAVISGMTKDGQPFETRLKFRRQK